MGQTSGGNQKVSNDPWIYAQGPLMDLYGKAGQALNNPPQYYPGQGYVSMNPYEQASLQGKADYATGAVPNLFGSMYNTNQSLLSGQNPQSSFANLFGGQTAANVGNLYQTPTIGASQFGAGRAPITANANPALRSMLSGQPDTRGFNEALSSAYEPLMRQWNQQVLPGIKNAADYATGGQGGSGAYKGTMQAGQDLAHQMTTTAGGLGYNAYQDAMNRQAQGAQLATQAGLSQYGTQTDVNSQNAQLRQQANLANQGAMGQTQGNLLTGAGLAGNMFGQTTEDQMRALALTPTTLQTGTMGSDLLGQVGQGYRGQEELALQDQMNRWNFQQQQPQDMLSWYNSILQPSLGSFGTQTQNGGGSNALLGGLGGGLGGYGLASSLGATNPWLLGGSALLGALGGMF